MVNVFGVMFAVLFDIPVPVILTYGLIAGLHSLLTHFKVLLPEKCNKYLSYLIVTPNFHRVHHSLDMKEGNSNFGIVFPYWDRLFGTFTPKKYSQMKTIKLGISSNQTPKEQTILKFLINPFISKTN
jgi:sterol desaturase/sphingolipid hydroxylase (fatty acid hydroxylase superfamily)